MIAAVLMTEKWYVMETSGELADYNYDEEECERLQSFIDEGAVVLIVDEIKTLEKLADGREIVKVGEEDE